MGVVFLVVAAVGGCPAPAPKVVPQASVEVVVGEVTALKVRDGGEMTKFCLPVWGCDERWPMVDPKAVRAIRIAAPGVIDLGLARDAIRVRAVAPGETDYEIDAVDQDDAPILVRGHVVVVRPAAPSP